MYTGHAWRTYQKPYWAEQYDLINFYFDPEIVDNYIYPTTGIWSIVITDIVSEPKQQLFSKHFIIKSYDVTSLFAVYNMYEVDTTDTGKDGLISGNAKGCSNVFLFCNGILDVVVIKWYNGLTDCILLCNYSKSLPSSGLRISTPVT